MSSSQPYRPDGFELGYHAALQPKIDPQQIDEGVLTTVDPAVLNGITHILRMWALNRPDLPEDFGEAIEVRTVARQPYAVLDLEIQIVERHLAPVDEPCPSGEVNASDWPTEDLFELSPLNPTLFPEQPLEQREPLAGRETRVECPTCETTGQVLCVKCGGAGKIICAVCQGSQRIVCVKCEGNGLYLGVSGSYVQCDACRTRGNVKCKNCERGELTCSGCKDGLAECGRCRGCGQLKQGWQLATTTVTERLRFTHLAETWPVDVKRFQEKTREILTEQWVWPGQQPPPRPLEKILPACFCDDVQQKIQQWITDAREREDLQERVTAVRLSLHGCFFYHVRYQFDAAVADFYMGGRENQFLTTLPRPHWFQPKRWFLRGVNSLFRLLHGTDRKQLVSPAYITAVQAGQAHISDTNCIVVDAAVQLQVTPEITALGYRLTIPLASADGGRERELTFDIDFDYDERHGLMLLSRHRLTAAHRERFPQALELNGTLSFGRISVVTVPETGALMFEFSDRRLLAFTSGTRFATVLSTAALELSDLFDRHALS